MNCVRGYSPDYIVFPDIQFLLIDVGNELVALFIALSTLIAVQAKFLRCAYCLRVAA